MNKEQNNSTGFSSVAYDYLDIPLDLNKELISNPSSTFFAKVKNSSLNSLDTKEGDIIIIDKASALKDGCTIVTFLDDEFCMYKFFDKKSHVELHPFNDSKIISFSKDSDLEIWGVVKYIIKKL